MRCSVCDKAGHSRRLCPVRQRRLRALYAEWDRLAGAQARYQQRYKGATEDAAEAARRLYENRRAELRALIQQYE